MFPVLRLETLVGDCDPGQRLLSVTLIIKQDVAVSRGGGNRCGQLREGITASGCRSFRDSGRSLAVQATLVWPEL